MKDTREDEEWDAERPMQRFYRVLASASAYAIAVVALWGVLSLISGYPLLLKSGVARDLEGRGFSHVVKRGDYEGYQLWSVRVQQCGFTIKYDKLTGEYSVKKQSIMPGNLGRSSFAQQKYRERCLRPVSSTLGAPS